MSATDQNTWKPVNNNSSQAIRRAFMTYPGWTIFGNEMVNQGRDGDPALMRRPRGVVRSRAQA